MKTQTAQVKRNRTAAQAAARLSVLRGQRVPRPPKTELAQLIDTYRNARAKSDEWFKACKAAEAELLDVVLDAGGSLETAGVRVRAVDAFEDAKTGEFKNAAYRAKEFKRFSLEVDAI